MRTAVHGMPRLGEHRALKWALEGFWAGRLGAEELEVQGAAIRRHNWENLAEAGIDFIPSNEFSLYDHVLDAAVAVGAVPARFTPDGRPFDLACYFAMARGGDLGAGPVEPLDLTKWFDTNYHHLVPEIGPATTFRPDPTKAHAELSESAALGIATVPVLLGPFSLLAKSSGAEPGFSPMSRLDDLTGTYCDLLGQLSGQGTSWVRLDEPALVEDHSGEELEALRRAYLRLASLPARPKIAVSTYFGHAGQAIELLRDLPVEGVGLDFCRGGANLRLLDESGGLGTKVLFAGVVDGRNVWANDLSKSLSLLDQLGAFCDEVVVSTSCSLMHVPASLRAETGLDPEIRPWLVFAEEKLAELAVLGRAGSEGRGAVAEAVEANQEVLEGRRRSPLAADPAVRRAVAALPADPRRDPPQQRAVAQQTRLRLPALPTTTIGSFPQTARIRAARAAWRAGRASDDDYQELLRSEIDEAVALQEKLGLDVVVHGEPERDDMVRYFAAQLTGFALPEEGWVQSYGSRCVRPPVLYGEVKRPAPMTVEWSRYAQSLTTRPVKGMLTGPVTMLRWSFVRDDQPEAETAAQLALALRGETQDLQAAGIAVIQIDEPALREGLPLRAADQPAYLAWATRAFRVVSAAAVEDTQIHTHMCYARLADIVAALDDLDVDVVSLEAARSKMGLLDPLGSVSYRGGVGPGVYDVHSPRVPSTSEMEGLLRRALGVVAPSRLWVNPDCGLKTRDPEQVRAALTHMVAAARHVRAELDRADPALF